MKTHSEITHLNYNDIAFITGKTPSEAKFDVAVILNIKDFTSKGVPKVKLTDTVPTEKLDFKMKSNSDLEGQCRFKYLVDYYNKGCDVNTLRSLGENKPFIKKLKFTGKHDILNRIMNPEQMMKLQKIWLFANVYGKKEYPIEVRKFIFTHKWADEYLKSL